MAPSTTLGTLTDELFSLLVPTQTLSFKQRRLRDAFSRKLRHHNYARTNQFEVAERLDGLQEKFLVLNYDELSDALHSRLEELKGHPIQSEKWLPDVLHLLLQLSDDPARKTQVEDLVKLKKFTQVVPVLRWADVEADDPMDRKSQIWRDTEFSDLSSDEDPPLSIESSPPTSPEKIQGKDRQIQGTSSLVVRPAELREQNEECKTQFWIVEPESDVVISELEAVRESLFMLQGLPTTIFWRVGHSIEVDRRFRLDHISRLALQEILVSFSCIGLRVDVVRTWVKRLHTVASMQSLHGGIERMIFAFDVNISQMQSQLLVPQDLTIVSLVRSLEAVSEASKPVLQMADLVDKMNKHAADDISCLEVLYDAVCLCQASGEDDTAELLSKLFLSSFEAYLRPIVKWIRDGELDPVANGFFITSTGQNEALAGLWEGWYSLSEGTGARRAPRFLQSVVRQIFVTGKNMVFLRRLQGQMPTDSSHAAATRSFSMSGLRAVQASGLLPFSESFEIAAKSAIGALYVSSSTLLREKVGLDCGLWRTIDALGHVYFGKSGYMTDIIDAKIFERIDRGNHAWSDRFLLTELYRDILGRIETVDAERLLIQPYRSSTRDMQSQRRSVKILSSLSLEYNLPWPVANTISKNALIIYRRISTFLFQIRRARYVLERGCRFPVMTGRLDLDLGSRNLAQQISHQLLLFVNSLYDHLTSFVIDCLTNEMSLSLVDAVDMDDMIKVHQTYITKLDELCLTSKKLGTIRQAMITVLDLCIRFSDTVTSPTKRRHSDVEATSFRSAASRPDWSLQRRQTNNLSSDEDSEQDEEEGEEGFSTFITFDEYSYESVIRDIKTQLARQQSFIVTGLRSIGRVDEQSTGYEILAERLDWKK